MAPTVGIEPTTNRLTADCSTAELSRNNNWRPVPELNRYQRICSPLHNHSANRPICKYQSHSPTQQKLYIPIFFETSSKIFQKYAQFKIFLRKARKINFLTLGVIYQYGQSTPKNFHNLHKEYFAVRHPL